MKGTLKSLGLGGDGDEVDAIENVERAFGVVLDKRDAPSWVTVGDVYASLIKALVSDLRDREDTWERFVTALSEETGVDALKVGPETKLLAPSVMEHLRDWLHAPKHRS